MKDGLLKLMNFWPIFYKLFKKEDLTSGSITKNILAVVFSLWIGTILYTVFMGLDTYWVSRLGSVAIAALAVGGSGYMIFWTALVGLSNATIAILGERIGQKDYEGANTLSGEILTTTIIASFGLGLVGYLITPGLLKLLGASPEVAVLATGYLRIYMAGAIISFPVYVINSILRSGGDMFLPMLIVGGQIILNLILDPLLILGIGLPKLGINGAALAGVIAGAVSTIAGLLVLVKGKSFIKLDLKKIKLYFPRLHTLRETLRLVGPNTVELLGISVVGLVIVGIVARWGTNALAAYGIGTRLNTLVSLPGLDLAMATAIIMSNNLGARKIKRAIVSTWTATGFNMLIMGIGGIVLFVLAEEVVRLFAVNPEVVSIGVNYLKITIPGWLFLAVWTILRRAFIGAKDVTTPLFISFFTLIGVQIPVAIYLPKAANIGVSGIWWAILVATLAQGIISGVLFQCGRWKTNIEGKSNNR
jgi:putative MATE family efflux protein